MCCIFYKDEYVQLVAKHYYIQFSSANNQGNVQKVVEECIPIHLIERKSMSKWIQLISAARLEVYFGRKKNASRTKKVIALLITSSFLQGSHISRNQSREGVKEELVDRASHRWPLDFSRFYEVILKSGVSMQNNKMNE